MIVHEQGTCHLPQVVRLQVSNFISQKLQVGNSLGFRRETQVVHELLEAGGDT